jgi:hypothetical protein
MSGPIESRAINIPANEIIAPASPDTYCVAASGPHAVMAEHITRIADFIEARIDEQFAGQQNATRYFDDDPISRSLRALRRVVVEIRSKTVLVPRGEEPGLRTAVGLALDYAWSELTAIAKEWADHPDYLNEFTLLAFQVEAKAATPDAP